MKKNYVLHFRKLRISALLFFHLMFSTAIFAQPPGFNDAVYNVTTGTWFKMIVQNGNWYNANISAQALLNTAGWTSRLAVLDNPTLHSFGRTLPGMGPWHIVWIYECDVNNGWKLGGTGYNSILCQNKNDIQGEYIAEFIPPPPCTDFEEVLDSEICEGDIYSWRGNDYLMAGTYFDSLFTTNPPGCDSVYVLNLQVHPLPFVTINVPDTFYCVYDQAVTFDGIPSGGTFSGNGISGNVFDPSVAGAGSWSIMYSYTDSSNCTNSFSVMITVDDCLSVDFSEGSDMLIFPVPLSDNVNLKIYSLSTADLNWSVLTVEGKTIQKGMKSLFKGENHVVIDTSELLNGVYLLQTNLNGATNTSVVIKQ